MLNLRNLSIAVSLLVCLALTGAAEASDRLIRLDKQDIEAMKKEWLRAHEARQQKSKPGESSDIVQLTGELRYSRRTGLTLNGTAIQIGGDTNTFPQRSGHTDGTVRHPRTFNGKTVTVFGVSNGIFVKPTLIIEHGAAADEPGLGGMDAIPTHLIPSKSDSNVGELGDGAAG